MHCTGTSRKELFVRLGPYENGSKIKPPKEQKLDDVPPQSSDARKLRSAKKKLREKLEHLLCIRKQEAEVNEEEAMDTDTQSSSQGAEVNEEEMDTDTTQSSSSSLW